MVVLIVLAFMHHCTVTGVAEVNAMFKKLNCGGIGETEIN
jgi:hypothetical protein